MIQVYQMVCLGSGISPLVMAGIWFHETGGGTSEAWQDSINPGGIKYRAGMMITSLFGKSKTGLYARYPNRYIAAAAHVMFLRQERYSRAWGAAEADQIREIATAGYVAGPGEPDNWIANVTKFAREAGAKL